MQILISILLASVPALVWGHIFYQKNPVYRPKALETFLLGIASVVPILLYKWSWNHFPNINIFSYTDQLQTDVFAFTPHLYLPLGVILAFMFVGVIEEYMKNLVVRKVDKGFFRNIDDAIEFSIMSALGFAFIENILYFYYIWEYQGTDILMISFVFRAIFSTFAHVLFSGVYGYYYGIAYFADPVWSEELRKKRHPIIEALHKIFHLKKNRIFATEKITEGLFLAVFLHGLFNILLEMSLTFFMVPFLVIGYGFLDYLFGKKENLKIYGKLAGDYSKEHWHHAIWNRFSLLKLFGKKFAEKQNY